MEENFTIIVPTLNEASALPDLLAQLEPLIAGGDEVVIADGGSSDATRQLALSVPGVRVVPSARGRGPQMNAGARTATGNVLLFLHADTELPRDWKNLIGGVLRDPACAGGAFTIRFDDQRLSLRIIGAGISFRTRFTRTATGDQAIFLRREVFERLGGFKDWPLFEDVDLVSRLKKVGRFAVITEPVVISPRRYLKHGVWRTTLLMWLLRLGYWIGVSPVRLKGWFPEVRTTRNWQRRDQAV